jgi:GT2 family glycosyltransferase
MLGLAMIQTRLPLQIIVVDASDNWAACRDRLVPSIGAAGVEIIYVQAPKRSLTVQRNTALEHARGEIIFFLDDDTLLYPDCAERILEVYERDREGWIAGVTAPNLPLPPESAASGLYQKASGKNANAVLLSRLQNSKLFRWAMREILLMNHYRLFVPYDDPPIHWQEHQIQVIIRDLGLSDVDLAASMFGYAMTVRRTLAEREHFDSDLLAYSPAEDTDFSYRVSRHGALLVCNSARLHHFEAASGRLKRKQVSALFLTNCALFLRKHATNLPAKRRQFMWLLWRRYLAELLKDGLSRRWNFPNLAGVAFAHALVRQIFDHPLDGIGPWYEKMQQEILLLK